MRLVDFVEWIVLVELDFPGQNKQFKKMWFVWFYGQVKVGHVAVLLIRWNKC